MYNGVKEYMGWMTGGGPEMLVENVEVLRKPEETTECLIRTYEKKLKKVENRIGKPRGDHLRTLRKMICNKIRLLSFRHVTVKEI
jgi:hypothetical protein